MNRQRAVHTLGADADSVVLPDGAHIPVAGLNRCRAAVIGINADRSTIIRYSADIAVMGVEIRRAGGRRYDPDTLGSPVFRFGGNDIPISRDARIDIDITMFLAVELHADCLGIAGGIRSKRTVNLEL